MENTFLKDNPLATITTLVLYFGACAGLWHVTYWSLFDINYFQYIEVSDIIKDFAQPLFHSLFNTVLVFGIGQLLRVFVWSNQSNNIRVRILMKILICFLGILIIVVFIFIDSYSCLRMLPFIIGLILSEFALKMEIFKNQITSKRLRYIFISFLLLLPLISFFFSFAKGLEVREGLEFKYVTSITYKQEVPLDVVKLKMIGVVKNNIFLTDCCSKKVTILNLENVNSITYTTAERSVDYFSINNMNKFHNYIIAKYNILMR